MAKIKNWDRNKEMERKTGHVYHWTGKGRDFIRVADNDNPYHNKYVIRGKYKGKSIGGGFYSGKITRKRKYSNKENARKAAVEFMKNHNYDN
jgi:hypothetical protein